MSEASFAEFFNRKLKEKGFSLKQLSDISGISLKHLEQFAHGRFENLPATPYVHGYFKRLGEILGFDSEEWWSQVKDESGVARSGGADRLPKNRYSARSNKALIGIGILVLLLLSYVGFRAYKIIGKPELLVTAPAENSIRVGESRILVAGRVKNTDEVTINGEQVQVEADGSFHKDVALLPGVNQIEIVAKKLLGRQTKVTKQVYYDASPIQILLPDAPTSSTASSTGTSTE